MVNTDNRKEEIGAHAVVSTTKGWIAILASRRGIQRLSLPHSDPSEALSSLEMSESSAGGELDPETLGGLGHRLELYFSGERADFPDDLDLKGTDFQKRAWEAARTIPWGETRSYQWIAREMGRPRAARAVGQAMRANPVPIIVPCHRVVGERGDLRGYGGPDGIGMKRELLEMERSIWNQTPPAKEGNNHGY